MHAIKGNRFVGARYPAWHALGTVVQEDITVREAIEIGEIDFEYLKIPVGYTLPNGRYVELDDQFMIVREPLSDDPQYKALGVVGKDYTFLQNVELAEGLDKLAKETGWKFETVGALGDGETVFMTLNMGDQNVKGDKYQNYAIVSDGKIGNRALQISIAPVRVVCQNTLMASDSASSFKVKINHSRYVKDQYDFWTANLGEVERAQKEVFKGLDEMASVKIKEDQAREIIEVAYPLPIEPEKMDGQLFKLAMENDSPLLNKLTKDQANFISNTKLAEARRDAAMGLYVEFNAGNEYGLRKGRATMDRRTLSEVRETPYAVLQAVTELVDWGGSRGGRAAAENVLFGLGSKVKRRTYEEALRVARS